MYLNQEPTTFINVKITDEGRRLLSLGKLTFDTAVLSDREVKYNIDPEGDYDICNNRVLSPVDNQPFFTSNFDGSIPIALGAQSAGSSKQIVTAQTESVGFFTGSTNAFGIDPTEYLGQTYINYSANTPNGTDIVTVDVGTSYYPNEGDLAFVMWTPPQNSGSTIDGTSHELPGENPTLNSWYKVLSSNSGLSTIEFDRPVPNFGVSDAASTQTARMFFYPNNGMESYYGSATTVETKVWNMNIVRTSSEIGVDSTVSGYTTYGSIEYNGTKQYLGFSSETRQLGIIHYSNKWSGNTYAEQFQEKSMVLDIPNVMWHKYDGVNNGEGKKYGITLNDSSSDSLFDNVAQTNYTELKDGTASNANIVGRVYQSLKIIVITDPELLTALSYKSNRNYTLPALNLSLISSPKAPLTTSEASGYVTSGVNYYATYIVESESIADDETSFGYPQTLHCGYISKIEGQLDSGGGSQYLRADFPTNSFPYLRSAANMGAGSAFSGTGWNANKVQLLIQSATTLNANPNIDTLSTENWTLVSNEIGNGIYSGDTGDTTVDPLKLNGYQFVVSNEDIVSGTTYSLALAGKFSGTTTNQEHLDLGDESFFFGNLTTAIKATSYKTVFTIIANNTEFNSSLNSTFDSVLSNDTYITEAGILNTNGVLVATGKPSYPLKKNDSRFLAFQLEIDF